ncbi:MAG: hypothetical protein AAGD14_19710, partial [Planctomycetota bacterium]
VEICAADRSLLKRFLDPQTNARVDDWGGTLAARSRLLRDALRVVRDAVHEEFVVGVRTSIAGDEAWLLGGLLRESGADYIHFVGEIDPELVHALAPSVVADRRIQ